MAISLSSRDAGCEVNRVTPTLARNRLCVLPLSLPSTTIATTLRSLATGNRAQLLLSSFHPMPEQRLRLLWQTLVGLLWNSRLVDVLETRFFDPLPAEFRFWVEWFEIEPPGGIPNGNTHARLC